MSAELLLREFERICDTPSAAVRLRSFVLDLAVRGRLATQDPRDEPAPELLARLEPLRGVGRRRRIARADEQTSDNAELEQFALPEGWAWAQFNAVAIIQSHLVDPSDYPDSPHIAPDNIESRTGRLLPFRTIRESTVTSGKHQFESGCILYSKIRPALVKAALADFDGLCSADMYPIAALIDRNYLHTYMLSDAFTDQTTRVDNRVAMPKINQDALSKVAVAVPPLAEQQRIVAKVEQLMAVCAELEASLESAQHQRGQLLEALLHDALNESGPTALTQAVR